jgi:purine nucleosidase
MLTALFYYSSLLKAFKMSSSVPPPNDYQSNWQWPFTVKWVSPFLMVYCCLFCLPPRTQAQAASTPPLAQRATEKIIIDTDIGGDIDDAFAVALALQSPELEILGITTASGDTVGRAKILDRMLGASGRQDIPVAVGIPTTLPSGTPPIGRQGRFGEHGQFVRPTHPPAVEFIIEQIYRSPGQITLITIGPLTNVGAMIDKDPRAFRQLKRVVMMGCWFRPAVLWGGDTFVPGPETNIVIDVPAAQKLFRSGVPIYVIPTDATFNLKLDEVKRDTLLTKGTPLTDSLALLYLMWGSATPILWDAMAIGYVVDPQLCPVEPMHVAIDDKGVSQTRPGEPNAQVCLHSDPEAFFHFYMDRVH